MFDLKKRSFVLVLSSKEIHVPDFYFFLYKYLLVKSLNLLINEPLTREWPGGEGRGEGKYVNSYGGVFLV